MFGLKLGYVRGAPLNVNHVVSIKNYGNYLVEKIVQASDSLFLKKVKFIIKFTQ
jgi:hypothetical protein